jgi:iron complex outermembrane recepter protein
MLGPEEDSMYRPLSLIIAAGLACAVWPVFAEETPPSDSGQTAADRTYVVTASRVAEEALAAPALVAVVTAEEIADSGARSVVEVLEKVVGVTFKTMSNAAQAEPAMRGFGENSFGRVLVLVDGRSLNNPDMQAIDWLAVNLADVERIEVLQGPAAVRYGDKAIGGVINIITRRPAGKRTELSLSAGSFGENRESFVASVGGEGKGVNVAAEHYSSEGYRDRSGYRAANASVRGFLDLSDTFTVSGGASLADIFYEMPGDLTEDQFKEDPRQTTNWGDESREHSYVFETKLDWKPSASLAAELPLSYSFKELAVDMPSWSPASYTDRLVHSFDLRPQASLETAVATLPLRLVAGTDVHAAFLDVATYAETGRTTKTNSFDVSQIAFGPYLSARLGLTDELSLEGGARYDRQTIAAENADASVDDSKTHQAFVYDAGIAYRPVETARVYLRYSTLFRYPFTDEQTSLYGGGYDVFLDDLEAETGRNAEVGASIALGKRLTVDADAYWLAMEDEIAFDPVNYRNENLAATRRLGGDLAVSFSPAAFAELRGTYGYVDAIFTDGAYEDERVPLVSAHRVDAELTLKAPFDLSVSPRVSFRSQAYQGGDYANDRDSIEAYAVYGLTLRFVPAAAGGALQVVAKADNLFDLSYAPLVYYNGYYSSYYPAAGRSFSLSASYRY